jgi:hypothetical protein
MVSRRCQVNHWQRLKNSGNSAALASYEDEMLFRRDARQFPTRFTVRILRNGPGKNQVKVAMETPRRLLGSS